MSLTIKLALAFLLALAVAVVVGKFYVPWLRRIKAGQEIREEGPSWHQSKSGTPTMGGIIFIAGVFAAVFVVGFMAIVKKDLGGVYVLVFSMLYGTIGFLDDFEKLKKKQNQILFMKIFHKPCLES